MSNKNEKQGVVSPEFEKLKQEYDELKKQQSENEKVLLLAHRMCWLLAHRMRKCSAQNEAFKNMQKFREAIGVDRAEKLEKQWRGVTAKKE